MIDKADSIEEEKDEEVTEEKLSSLLETTKENDEELEAIEPERGRSSSSYCDTMKCDKETFSAVAKNETQSVDIKARKSSIVGKKSFESDSEATTASPPTSIRIQATASIDDAANLPTCKRKSMDKRKSDDDAENAQSKNVETQQDVTEAQEIELNTDARNECQMRKASKDETTHECYESVTLKRKSIDDKPKQIFMPQHTISQEEDYEIGLVSGLLPGLLFLKLKYILTL